MCIAIFKPEKVVLTKAVLKTCFNNNKDGAGFAYPSHDKDKVIIQKGFFAFREFWTRFREVQERRLPILIHFRVATSGVIDKKNCHPWRIDNNHVLIHNGVVANKLGLQSNDCSDTGLFVEHVLRPTFAVNSDVWKTPAYQWLIQESIGTKNKMVILDSKGFSVIFNEKIGEWHNGAWFSNDTYKNARKSTFKVGESWIEQRPNGDIIQATRKGGTINYKPVKNPLQLNGHSSFDSKILKFAQNQTGVTFSQKTEDKPLVIPVSEILEEERERIADMNGIEADLSMMH